MNFFLDTSRIESGIFGGLNTLPLKRKRAINIISNEFAFHFQNFRKTHHENGQYFILININSKHEPIVFDSGFILYQSFLQRETLCSNSGFHNKEKTRPYRRDIILRRESHLFLSCVS